MSRINTSHIPVILLTAKTDEEEQTQGYLCGADAYIPKQHFQRTEESRTFGQEHTTEPNVGYRAHFKQTEELNITQIFSNNPRDREIHEDLVEFSYG